MSFTIGIDPGLFGAIAAIDHHGALDEVYDMPIVAGDVSPSLLVDLLRGTGRMIDTVYVEAVHSMPKQGVASSFKFGKGYGVVLGVIAGLALPVELVTPGTWKRAMKVTADKETARRRAIELWPSKSELFKLKKHHGRAEAALLALWGSGR